MKKRRRKKIISKPKTTERKEAKERETKGERKYVAKKEGKEKVLRTYI